MCIAVDGTKQRPGVEIKKRKGVWENGNKREVKQKSVTATRRNVMMRALSKMARAEYVAELTREYWSNRAVLRPRDDDAGDI